jgi:hypothetical protein
MILGFPQNVHQSGRRIAQSIILHNPCIHVQQLATAAKWVKLHLAPIFSTYLTNNGSNVEFILILILKTSDIQKCEIPFTYRIKAEEVRQK